MINKKSKLKYIYIIYIYIEIESSHFKIESIEKILISEKFLFD